MQKKQNLFLLSAFSDHPDGGNPAGVWIGAGLPGDGQMQEIAAKVGFSETAFVAPLSGPDREVRYFSPLAEVSFCGHATIAAGVVLGRENGAGTFTFNTQAGPVEVRTRKVDGRVVASLVSVATRHKIPAADLLDRALRLLQWQHNDLDPAILPAVAYAGAWHLVLAAHSQTRLEKLDYDFEALRKLMLEHELTTLQLVWREHPGLFHSRNAFPVGGVVEDAATGAAAAALGGYLRDAGLVRTPARFEISQGVAMGRPSRLGVMIPDTGGIEVSGTAVDLS